MALALGEKYLESALGIITMYHTVREGKGNSVSEQEGVFVWGEVAMGLCNAQVNHKDLYLSSFHSQAAYLSAPESRVLPGSLNEG